MGNSPSCNTRLAAHERVAPSKKQTCEQILLFATGCGRVGFTVDELTIRWDCSPNHVAPRVCELKKAGRLVTSGRTRLTRSGSPAQVFVLPEFASSTSATLLGISSRSGVREAPRLGSPSISRESSTDTLPLFSDLRPEPRYPD